MIELYEFEIGLVRSFFTSADQDVLQGGETYQAVPMSRSAIQSSATDFVSKLQIETHRHHPIALSAQKERIEVYVSNLENSIKTPLWEGSIVQVSWTDAGAVLACEDNLSPIKKLTPTKRYTRNCRHILYSEHCGVDIDDVSIATKVLAIDYDQRTADLEIFNGNGAAGYYGGGLLLSPDGSRHQILTTGQSHVDDWTVFVTIQLMSKAELPLGLGYSVVPGCDHTRDQCSNKFGNIINFGGFAYISFDDSGGQS